MANRGYGNTVTVANRGYGYNYYFLYRGTTVGSVCINDSGDGSVFELHIPYRDQYPRFRDRHRHHDRGEVEQV